MDLAACIREDDSPPLPEIIRVTSSQFEAQLRSDAEEMGYQATPWDALLPKLKLLPEGKDTLEASIDVLSTSVAAFYHEKNKNITIITDNVGDDEVDNMYTMLHELTHYLQDRESDLTALQEDVRTSDERISFETLIEGEAVVTSTRGLTAVMRFSPRAFNWEAFFDALTENIFAEIAESDAPLLTARQFLPYAVGGRYVSDVWAYDNREDVDALFEQWPHNFADWIRADISSPIDNQKPPLDCGPPLAPTGFKLYELDSFGASGVVALLAAAGSIDLGLPSTLRNDAFAVYIDEAGMNAIGVWRLRFASAGVAKEVADRIDSLGFETRTFDEEIAIRVSSDASIEALTGDALDACPMLEELKPMREGSDLPASIREILH